MHMMQQIKLRQLHLQGVFAITLAVFRPTTTFSALAATSLCCVADLKKLTISCADDLSIIGLASLTRLTGLALLGVIDSGHNFCANCLDEDDVEHWGYRPSMHSDSQVRTNVVLPVAVLEQHTIFAPHWRLACHAYVIVKLSSQARLTDASNL
jgi:hypothetical protein